MSVDPFEELVALVKAEIIEGIAQARREGLIQEEDETGVVLDHTDTERLMPAFTYLAYGAP